MGDTHVRTMHVPNMRDGYVEVCRSVLRWGERARPRDMETREIIDAHIIVDDVTDTLPVAVGRSPRVAIGAGEAIQLIAGRASHALMPRITPVFANYAEDDGRFHGAYGDRVSTQVLAAEYKLRRDRDTRQAVISLWDPLRDNVDGKRDYPCTVALQFLVRNDRLLLLTTMRSNDVWLGLAYDVFQFTQLQLTLARALGVEPGEYRHHVGSLHVYEPHFDLVESLEVTPGSHRPDWHPLGFGRDDIGFLDAKVRAARILNGRRPGDLTSSEEWYVDTLWPYLRREDT